MKYKPNTEYYTIVTDEQLNTVIPDMVVEFMGYDQSKVHTLRSACFPFPQELEDGTFLISIQLSNTSHYDNKCVLDYIDKTGFDLAVSFYGIENIFTDITGIEFKGLNINLK